MDKLLQIVDRCSHWMGVGAACLMPVLIVVVNYEVIARYVFQSPTAWALETTMFCNGCMGALGGGYCLLYKAHINIDVLYDKIKSARVRAILDMLGFTLLGGLFLWALIWAGGEATQFAMRLGEHSNTNWAPLVWPVKLTIVIGAVMFLLQGIAKWIRDLRIAIKGRAGA